jgi:hypothetical protein
MRLPLRGAVLAAGIPFLATASSAWPFGGGGTLPEPVEAPSALVRAQTVISDWPERSRALAETLLQEYGAPDETGPSRLSWSNRNPWRKVEVERDSLDPARPTGLLQSVAYDVPLRRWRALGWFGRGVDYDPVSRELIARTRSEATNRLALNLADEVIRGRRTAEEARAFYDQTVALALAGKSSPYTIRLLFHP